MSNTDPRPVAGIVRRIARASSGALPAGFFPLRLRLNPGSLCLELGSPLLVLGRHSSADIRIPLPDVSRRHCRFNFADGHWEVVDLSSLNGTYVNGVRLHSAVLSPSDTLRIGGLTFEVEFARDAATSAVIESIARILPADPAVTQEYRKAS